MLMIAILMYLVILGTNKTKITEERGKRKIIHNFGLAKIFLNRQGG